jgi:membrane protease YdiL (CAAX protease family)
MTTPSRGTAITDTRAPLRSQPDASQRRRALVAYFALAYALSWSWAIPLALAGDVVRRGTGWPTHYPALFGPAIAAIVVTAWSLGLPGVRDLLARMVQCRVALRWWLTVLSPLGFLVVGLAVLAAVGQPMAAISGFAQFSGTPSIGLAGVVLLVIVGALAEETGWRGYALPSCSAGTAP